MNIKTFLTIAIAATALPSVHATPVTLLCDGPTYNLPASMGSNNHVSGVLAVLDAQARTLKVMGGTYALDTITEAGAQSLDWTVSPEGGVSINRMTGGLAMRMRGEKPGKLSADFECTKAAPKF